jgi:hypothetical protein
MSRVDAAEPKDPAVIFQVPMELDELPDHKRRQQIKSIEDQDHSIDPTPFQ